MKNEASVVAVVVAAAAVVAAVAVTAAAAAVVVVAAATVVAAAVVATKRLLSDKFAQPKLKKVSDEGAEMLRPPCVLPTIRPIPRDTAESWEQSLSL